MIDDASNMGGIYGDEDVVVDGDLVAARTGGHCQVVRPQDNRLAVGR